jgi:putative ATPase
MNSDDLFAQVHEERRAAHAPLAARMRPRTIEEVVGQQHLLGENAPLRRLIESDRVSSVILWGPPGTGKTTIAELIALTTKKQFERLSAVSAGVKEVREVIDRAQTRMLLDGMGTVVFIDEIHRFSTNQQDALLHAVETGTIALVGATTENPAFSVNPALRSRSSVFALNPVSEDDIVAALNNAVARESATAESEAVSLIARRATGDVRQALTSLEVALTLCQNSHVQRVDAENALRSAVQRLGNDDHYNIASAFIKSMRHGETDIALHWLARMIEAGEDPRFIARRVMIFASEDIGMADHTALLVAVAAAQAVEKVGLPEAAHHLAHAVIHLSQAKKSRAVTDALAMALDDVRQGRTGAAPPTTADPPEFAPRGTTVNNYYRGAHDTGIRDPR